MAATQAQALVANLDVRLAKPEEDISALERLGLWAIRRYSPHVAIDPPDGLILDATGAAHLFGGEAAMLEDLTHRLASSSIAAKAAMAGTWGAAYAIARFLKPSCIVVSRDELVGALAPLPIAALRLSSDEVHQLRRLGFETIGELNATARAPLVLRFGHQLLRRIDQAYGRLAEPFIPLEPSELPRVTRAFAEPISAPETLHRYTEKLAIELAMFLETNVLGASQVDLLFVRVDARIEAIRAGFAKATRDSKRLTRILVDRIETIDPGLGIERMTLIASRTDALPYRAGSALGEPVEKDISELVDTLANRVGQQRLYRHAAVESDIPERSVTRIPPLAEPTDLRWPINWPRPSRLLPSPEHIETTALLPDHPPVQFSWRGQRRRVKRADGPERIHGEWIRSATEAFSVRDYFVVEDDCGERFWIFRAGDGEDPRTGDQRWYLHGLFG
jgi:protein ImuB